MRRVSSFLEQRPFILVLLFFILLGSILYRHLLTDPGILNYGDTLFPTGEESLNNIQSLATHTWWDHEYLGYDTSVEGIPKLSYIGLISLVHLVSGNFSIAQFLWWVLIFTISGISMYLLVDYIFKKRSAAFLASLVYALSPWFIDRFTHVSIVQTYAFAPFLFLFFMKMLDTGKLKDALFFALVVFFVIPSYQFTFMIAVVLFLYLLFRLSTGAGWRERLSYVWRSLKVLGITAAVLAFYILPLALSFAGGGGTVSTALGRWGGNEAGLYYGQDCTLLNVIRLLGFHDSMFKGSILGAAQSLEPPPAWKFLIFAIPGLCVIPFLFNRWESASKYFFCFLLLAGILISSSPTLFDGALFKFFGRLPLMNDPNYYVGVIAFAVAPLFGLGGNYIIERGRRLLIGIRSGFLRRGYDLAMVLLPVLLVLFIAYPLVTWKDYRYEQVSYPAEYQNMSNLVNQSPNGFRVLMLPPFTSIKHGWSPYFWLSSADGYLFNKPFWGRWALEQTPQDSMEFSDLLKTSLLSGDNVSGLLALANTRYIVVMNDCESQEPYIYIEPGELEGYLNGLNNQKGVSLMQQSSEVSIYEMANSLLVPHIYSPQSVIYSGRGDVDALPSLVSLSDDKLTCIFLKDNKTTGTSSLTVHGDGWYEVLARGDSIISNDPQGDITWESLASYEWQGKFFPSGCQGYISGIQYYTRNTSGVAQTVTISLAAAVSGAEILSVTDTIPPGTPEGWRTVPVGRFWDYENCFVYFKGQAGGAIIPWAGEGSKGADHFYSQDGGATWKVESGIGQMFFRIIYSLDKSTLEIDGRPLEAGQKIAAGEDSRVSFGSIYLEKGGHSLAAYTETGDGGRIPVSNLDVVLRSSEPAASLTFEKLGPTRYIARVQAEGPFFIVFSESFSRQWRAYINSDGGTASWLAALFKGGVPEDTHFLVNGYANAWYIDPDALGIKGDSFTITLNYRPQSFYYLGWIITGLTFFSSIGYLLWGWRRKRYKRKEPGD
jgi:hypothetical protein